MHVLETNKAPLIKQGWLRVIAFFVFFFIMFLLSGLVISVIVLAIPQLSATVKGNAQVSPGLLYVGFLVLALISVISVFLFRKFVDRKTFSSLGIAFRGHERDALLGLLLSAAILGTGTLLLTLNGNITWVDIRFEPGGLFMVLLLLVCSAIGEELVFRGYILDNLLSSFNQITALLISAALFALFHINNPDINAVALFNLFCGGLLLGVNYIFTRNLWFSFAFHVGWNFLQGSVLGYKVSGIELDTIMVQETSGNILLTGGEFGFEGSILQGILCLIAFIILYFFYQQKNTHVSS
jgi:uncharacterized protein